MRALKGICPLCQREIPLTFHHLIPRKVHKRARFAKNYDRDQLNSGINICRMCHDGIHRRFDEMTLATRYNTLQALRDSPELITHYEWVSRQRRA